MMANPILFRSGFLVPTFGICFFISAFPVVVNAEPLDSGLYIFQLLSQPEVKPLRIVIAASGVWIASLYAVQLMRRLLGQAMLEIWSDRIVFRGVLHREIPINQVDQIEDDYGSMLIRLKHGRSVRIPVIALNDFYGAKRALERVNEQITSRSAT